MGYSITTISVHGENDIEVTATVAKDSEEFLSHKKVTGIVLYAKQSRADGLAVMSILLSDSGTVSLLKNDSFPEKFASDFLKKIFSMGDKIREYVEEKEKQI